MNDEIKLIRHNLSSIDLSNIKEDLTEDELDARARNIQVVYHDFFKEELDKLILKQVEFVAKSATSMEQVSFGRGTMNGISLVKEWMEGEMNYLIKEEEDNSIEPFKPI